MAKKPKTEKVEIRLPIAVLAKVESIAAYAGITVNQVINVLVAVEVVTHYRIETEAKP